MLIFFVFVKLLSLMTNTRERQSDYTEWEARWGFHTRAYQ